MILVDTSIWIEFFNSSNSTSAKFLRNLIETSESLTINGLIEMELLQGIKSDKQMQLTKRMLRPYQYYPSISEACLNLATDIFRKCRKNGQTIRKSIDCIIAANALENDLVVLHKDRDFRAIKTTFKDLKTIDF